MSAALRFTPLYVIQMFLEIKYGSNSCIFIPEALLESDPETENTLREHLRKIDIIANSDDSFEIIRCLIEENFMTKKFDTEKKYDQLTDTLMEFRRGHGFDVCKNLNDFLECIQNPHVINCDVVKDLMPIKLEIMFGSYYWISILRNIFKYILYLKIKHLDLVSEIEIKFPLSKTIHNPPGRFVLNDNYMFDY